MSETPMEVEALKLRIMELENALRAVTCHIKEGVDKLIDAYAVCKSHVDWED